MNTITPASINILTHANMNTITPASINILTHANTITPVSMNVITPISMNTIAPTSAYVHGVLNYTHVMYTDVTCFMISTSASRRSYLNEKAVHREILLLPSTQMTSQGRSRI